MAFRYSPKIVTNGLVFALDAANKKSYPGSGTNINDISGNGNNGTLTNGPTFDSGNGGSIVFDGSNDYVGFTNTPTNNSFTNSAWVYINSTGIANGIISWTVGTNRRELMLFYSDLTIVYGNDKYRRASYEPPIGEWVYLTTTYDGVTPLAYSNGNVVSLGSELSAGSGLSNQFFIGRLAFSTPYYFNGKISNAKIYNRALSSQEVLQNYNATKGRFGL